MPLLPPYNNTPPGYQLPQQATPTAPQSLADTVTEWQARFLCLMERAYRTGGEEGVARALANRCCRFQ